MQRVRISSVRAGQKFPKSMFLLSGQKLLGPNVPITDRVLELMRRQGETEVIVADSMEELATAGVVDRCETSELAVGQATQDGLITSTGTVLLEPGEEIEEHHLDAIRAAGGAFTSEPPAPPKRKKSDDDGDAKANMGPDRRERIIVADELVESLEKELASSPLRVSPAMHQSWIQPVDPASWPDVTELSKQRNAAVDTIRKLYARIEAGVPVSVEDFRPLLEDLLDKLAGYPTRFTQLALLVKGRDDYLPDHAYTVAVLAMSIAANLKWERDDVRRVGLGALVFDLGMLLVPQRIRVGASELSDMDRARVQKHPLFSLSMLQGVEGVPAMVRLAALQHHERENGSGYPRGRRKDQICDFARVLAVADAFAAAMGPRHYRKQKLPYVAMEETLRLASAMVFWTPACRALVQSAGLFPVGSYVKLSNGKRAHVIGSNASAVDRPPIQLLDDAGKPVGAPLDLATLPKQALSVVRPIDIDACTI